MGNRSVVGYHPSDAGRSPELLSRGQVRRGGIAVDRGRLVFVSIVRPVFLGGMRSVMCCSTVAIAARLLMTRVDVSATGADATIEERDRLVRIAVAAILADSVAMMIVGERWMRPEVQTTATARLFTSRVDVSATGADAAIERAAIIVGRAAAPTEDQRARRLDISAAWRTEPLGMPVDKGRPGGA